MKKMLSLTAPKALLHMCVGIVVWLAAQLFVQAAVPRLALSYPAALLLVCGIRIFLTWGMLALYCRVVLRISLADCRFGRPRLPGVWMGAALLLPVLVSCFFLFFVPGEMAAGHPDATTVFYRILTGVVSTCVTAAFTEELVFRGFAMTVLEARWGKAVAAILPSAAFALLHIITIRQPTLTDILLLIVAGTSVGIMFSLAALQTGSLWPSIVLHGLWNLVIDGGLLDIGLHHRSGALFTYTLGTDSLLLTGGGFGIESSLPAVAGYWLVVAMTMYLGKRKARRPSV